jgi:hypothetical protein
MTQITPKPENLAQLVFLVHGEKVILDADLAMLYGVETGALNRAVKRNLNRFPDDFMFRLSNEDWEDLKRQIGISSSPGFASASKGRNSSQSVIGNKKRELMRSQIVTADLHGGRRGLPYAFTEQGIAMLSSVLRSPRKTVEPSRATRPHARNHPLRNTG